MDPAVTRTPGHGLEPIVLAGDAKVFLGELPEALPRGDAVLNDLWSLRPDEVPTIHLHGRRVPLPRWQQAFGHDYRFSGQTSVAQPVPEAMRPYLDWARGALDPRLNGVLGNWYDGELGHYIGPHRDDVRQLVPETPIVTVSFGETRVFRLRPVPVAGQPHHKHGDPGARGVGYVDVRVSDGSVLVLSWSVNQRWKHEIPKSRRARGKRVSLTLRAFR